MVDFLLDTNVLVDLLRSYPTAINWKNSLANVTLGISPVVWMEIVQGSENLTLQRRALKFLQQFELVHLTPTDVEWAMNQLVSFQLSHNIEMNDCLIAAPSYRLQIPLYTRNLKHFTPILGTLAQQPY